MTQPQLVVIAGPNGAGKTTLTGKFLAGRIPVVNPDDYAKQIDPANSGNPVVMLQAGRLAVKEREALLANRQSFAIETTFTGKSELDLMARAAEHGYKVNLVYIGLRTPQLSAARVAERVSRGGHPVPTKDIFRRFDRSTAQLNAALPVVNRAWVIDNSSDRRRLLFSIEAGRVKHLAKDMPTWAQKAVPADLQQARHGRKFTR